MTDVIRLDAAALRVLAHPLRSRLLAQLRLHGAATATELADLLTTNTGATSYHLRKLESVGLVTDTGTGAGKRRVWEAVEPRSRVDAERLRRRRRRRGVALLAHPPLLHRAAGRGRPLVRGRARLARRSGATPSATATTVST